MKHLRPPALALVLLAAAPPLAADVVIRLRDGTVHRVPVNPQDVAGIEFTTGAALAGIPANAGQPWVITSEAIILRGDVRGWQRMPGESSWDVGVGADGSVWVLGSNRVPGGWGIWRFTGGNWVQIDGGAVAVTVDPRGEPWVVNNDGRIYQRRGGQWRELPGRARDIGAGADGSVWVVGTDNAAGGHSIYRWNGSEWVQIDGAATRIAVGPDGNPWVVNSEGRIYRRQNNAWTELPGRARDIAVSAGGTAWMIGEPTQPGERDGGVHYWNGSTWVRVEGAGIRVGVR